MSVDAESLTPPTIPFPAIVRGSTWEHIVVFVGPNGPVNVSGCTFSLVFALAYGQPALVSATATILAGPQGVVLFRMESAITDSVNPQGKTLTLVHTMKRTWADGTVDTCSKGTQPVLDCVNP